MALVPANEAQRNRLSRLAAGAVGQVAYNQLAKQLRSMATLSGYPTTSYQNETVPSRRSRRRKNKQQSNNAGQRVRGGNAVMPASIPRGLAGSQSMRTTLRDIVVLLNGSTGQAGYSWGLGVQNSSASPPINGLFNPAWIPRGAVLAGLYREFRIFRVSVQFVPYVSTTNSGTVAIGVDPDPSVGLPTSLGAPARHKASVITDLTEKAIVTYNPAMDGKTGNRFTFQATNRSDDEYSFGTVELFSNNSLANAASIGYVVFTVDVAFIGPM